MKRDLDIERQFITAAARHNCAFSSDVSARLQMGETAYGDQWQQRTPAELISEAIEETLDTAAWSVLALQRIDNLEAHDRDRIVAALDDAAYHAARAHRALVAAEMIARGRKA